MGKILSLIGTSVTTSTYKAQVVYVLVIEHKGRLPCLGCLNWLTSYKPSIDHAGNIILFP